MFYGLDQPSYHISAWTDDLIEKPDGKRKFSSIELNLKLKEKIIMRETYDVLTFVGDVGGLADGLLMLFSFMLSPYTSFKLRSYLLTHLFRRLPENVHIDKNANKGHEESLKIGSIDQQDVSTFSINFNRSYKKQVTES